MGWGEARRGRVVGGIWRPASLNTLGNNEVKKGVGMRRDM